MNKDEFNSAFLLCVHLRLLVVVFVLSSLCSISLAMYPADFVQFASQPDSFPLVQNHASAKIVTDPVDYPGVIRAAGDLNDDIHRVTGVNPQLSSSATSQILIGTIGKSKIIDQLIRDKKIDVSPIAGKWESFIIQTIPGALVIVGSDKRGTIYGIYDLSEQIGVSPWYWWADVPPQHHDSLFIKPGRFIQGPPAVQYRGIFLNDEAPALSGWANEKFGGYNHKFYAKVFELLLRLRANYLWPAMWNNCFSEDDPLNPKTADEYGIVMGTSHVEPMMRADKEWVRAGFTGKEWNYQTNPQALRDFWAAGIDRNKNYENIYTMAMRGKTDSPMASAGGMQANIALLEKVVADQRKILADHINPDVTKIPQLWCLYKEVQSYYEHGMRVPDDITLLWSDDNWGNIRRLPTPEERKRSGGAGVYYHFDYVGGPRNYKWIDTNPIPKVWEQMNLAHQYGANKIWIVNVGDLKPMEFPIDFFLSMAWDPDRWPKEKLTEFTRMWVTQQFGQDAADVLAPVISTTLKFNGRRKPELLDLPTYSLINYDEADQFLEEYKLTLAQVEDPFDKIPKQLQPAYYELALHPALAYETVLELYIAAAKNHLYASQKRASTNYWADQAQKQFAVDRGVGEYYNRKLLDGKWNHMMDQTHIGYTNWQEPSRNIMPNVVRLEVPQAASMGVALQGSEAAWPGSDQKPELPGIDPFTFLSQPPRWIEIFNRGKTPFDFSVTCDKPWVFIPITHGTITTDKKIFPFVNWSKVPTGNSIASIVITGSEGHSITISLPVFNPPAPTKESLHGFAETNGYVSMRAEDFTKKVNATSAHWDVIPGYGREGSAMSIFPVTASSVVPPDQSPCLEYNMYIFHPGLAKVSALIAPTQAFVPGRGLRVAFSIDDGPPQVVDTLAHNSKADWERSVMDNIRAVPWNVAISTSGYHTLKIWMVDPGIVLEKILVDLGGLKPSYLGPPESYYH
ncbi:MAG TPA: glycosyl hydrolase 115 family protein [Tepidisphaeraceae bacterium]|jgi:hypothetical protein